MSNASGPSGPPGGSNDASGSSQMDGAGTPPNLSSLDSPDVEGKLIKPPVYNQNDSRFSGSENVARGIQGLYHSSLLDSMLVGMFGFTDVFDKWLQSEGQTSTNEVQRILRESIVNPLRKRGYVGAKKIVALQLALQKAAELPTRFMVDEIDLNTFLEKLLGRGLGCNEPLFRLVVRWRDALNADNPLSYTLLDNMIRKSYVLSVNLKYDEGTKCATTEQLIESDSVHEGWKFLEKPSVLLLVLSRSNGAYGEQAPCLPLCSIDITNCIAASQRECKTANCTGAGEFECEHCYGSRDEYYKLNGCTLCSRCKETHLQYGGTGDDASHAQKFWHFGPLTNAAVKFIESERRNVVQPGANSTLTSGYNTGFSGSLPAGQAETDQSSPNAGRSPVAATGAVERQTLELTAIICKELSTYVAYVRVNDTNNWVYYSCAEAVTESPSGVVNQPVMMLLKNFDELIQSYDDKTASSSVSESYKSHLQCVRHKSYAYLYCAPKDGNQVANDANGSLNNLQN